MTANPASPNNPFVLPGFGQTGETASNPLAAGLEMMQQMQQTWQSLAGLGEQIGGGLAQAVPMNLDDLDKRISELRTVENWLKLNQSMLAGSIQALEVQRATLATLKSFVASAPAADKAADNAAEAKTAADATAFAGAEAAQNWWNLMQQQFGQLTQAAAASMQAAAGEVATAAATAPPAAPREVKRSAQTAAKKAAQTSAAPTHTKTPAKPPVKTAAASATPRPASRKSPAKRAKS